MVANCRYDYSYFTLGDLLKHCQLAINNMEQYLLLYSAISKLLSKIMFALILICEQKYLNSSNSKALRYIAETNRFVNASSIIQPTVLWAVILHGIAFE